MATTPKTLIEAVQFFSDKTNAVEYLAARRWPNGVECPCGSKNVTALKTRQLWQCKECRKQFSVKVGTIFEDSPLPLGKWLTAYWMLTNCRNGISSCEIARSIGVTQKTAWFMSHRIRETMKSGSLLKLSGTVEADETYVGGRDKNRHSAKKQRVTGGADKTVVFGAVERGGQVIASVANGHTVQEIQDKLFNAVSIDANLRTDEHAAYRGLDAIFASHKTVNHSEGEYVTEDAHTNTIENYWSLVKRMLKGTYIHVEPFHLDRYLHEQGYRYNVRKSDEHTRFTGAISQAPGRRLTYKELTGKAQAAQ
jgi:transposase-like protein